MAGELFGGELRILGAVDFRDGKVGRWVDYLRELVLDPSRDYQPQKP